MSVPKPKVVDDKLSELGGLCVDLLRAGAALRDPYTWAHNMGLQPTVVGDGGGSTQISQSDPTLAVVESTAKARVRSACVDTVRALEDAINGVKDALAIVEGAETGLRRLLPRAGVWDHAAAFRQGKELDYRHGTIEGRGKAEDGSFLAPGEYEQSASRQRDRAAAGEGFGES